MRRPLGVSEEKKDLSHLFCFNAVGGDSGYLGIRSMYKAGIRIGV